MTSYREPDYDLALELTRNEFKKIAGFAYTVRVSFGDRRGRFSGMVIVPHAQGFPRKSQPAEAWLWVENNRSSPVCTRVRITIGDPCNPMFFHLFEELSAHTGLRLSGVITRIHAADSAWDEF
jgi:hypothetical protein